MNVLRNPEFSVAFYDNFVLLSDFQKFMFFSGKAHLNYFLKINFWTFWELLLILSHSVTTLLLLPIFKLFIFFQKTHQFLGKKRTFWEIVIFQSHSTTILLSLAIFKLFNFFQKIHQFLGEKEPSEKSWYFSRIFRQFCYL